MPNSRQQAWSCTHLDLASWLYGDCHWSLVFKGKSTDLKLLINYNKHVDKSLTIRVLEIFYNSF